MLEYFIYVVFSWKEVKRKRGENVSCFVWFNFLVRCFLTPHCSCNAQTKPLNTFSMHKVKVPGAPFDLGTKHQFKSLCSNKLRIYEGRRGVWWWSIACSQDIPKNITNRRQFFVLHIQMRLEKHVFLFSK